jgi:hypothetical protein
MDQNTIADHACDGMGMCAATFTDCKGARQVCDMGRCKRPDLPPPDGGAGGGGGGGPMKCGPNMPCPGKRRCVLGVCLPPLGG